MKKGFIGVDTAKSSGAIFYQSENLLGVIPGATPELLIEKVDLMRSLDFDPIITIESHNPSKHPGMIKCYGGYKEVLGAAKALKCQIIEVFPRVWQSFWGFDLGNTKTQSLKNARELFPAIDFKKNHDQADAALICEYGKRTFQMMVYYGKKQK